jgi:hypothetical protein
MLRAADRRMSVAPHDGQAATRWRFISKAPRCPGIEHDPCHAVRRLLSAVRNLMSAYRNVRACTISLAEIDVGTQIGAGGRDATKSRL